MPDIFERPNKKSEETKAAEEKEEELLKVIGNQKIEGETNLSKIMEYATSLENRGKNAGYDGVTDGRFLYHPFGGGAGSKGCFGTMSDDGVSDWTNRNKEGTGAYYFQEQLDLFDQWGIYKGYEFNIRIKGKVSP